jgi:hypothetical protein
MGESDSYWLIQAEEYGLLMFMLPTSLTVLPLWVFLPIFFAKISACKRFTVIRRHRPSDYNGVFARKMREFGLEFEKASRPEPAKGFVPGT